MTANWGRPSRSDWLLLAFTAVCGAGLMALYIVLMVFYA